MKWGLQHVKVTLEEQDTGETVVIEQSPDGRVTCERVGEARREKAANTAPKTRAEVKVEATPEPKSERGRKPEAEEPRSKKAETKAPEPEDRPRRAKKAGKRRKAEPPRSSSTRLEWRPIRDFKFDGFGAESGVGMFKALHTRGDQWALFYEIKGFGAKKIACFLNLKDAQDRAKKLHTEGWSEFGPLSADRIGDACPVPESKAKEDPKEAPKAQAAPKTEDKPAAPETPPPPPASTAEAEQDKELLRSFGAELDKVLSEDEDEDD